MTIIETYMNKLKTGFHEKILHIEIYSTNRLKIQVEANNLVDIMNFIANELEFPSLEAVSGIDWESYKFLL